MTGYGSPAKTPDSRLRFGNDHPIPVGIQVPTVREHLFDYLIVEMLRAFPISGAIVQSIVE
jgi:hypothetical protein